MPDGSLANLFCSGHTFLPDGRLFVAGGHLADGAGVNQTTVYDPVAGTWTPGAPMNAGRWYPTVTRLPDGSVLVLSGSFAGPGGGSVPNTVPQVWRAGTLSSLAGNPQGPLDLYPRVHVRSNGQVLVTGSLAETWSLTPPAPGPGPIWAFSAPTGSGTTLRPSCTAPTRCSTSAAAARPSPTPNCST